MRTYLLLAALGVLTLLLAQVLDRRQLPSPSAAAAIPLEARFEEYVAASTNDTLRISTRRLLAIAADGSSSTSDTNFTTTGQPVYTHRELVLASGVKADIIDTLRIVTAYRFASGDIRHRIHLATRWNPAQQCATTYDGSRHRGAPLRANSYLGHPALVFTSADSVMRATSWVIPTLDCLEVHRRIEFAGGQISELRATAIQLGPPSRQTFELPRDYEHVTPSEALRRDNALRGGAPLDAAVLRQFVTFDQQYEASRYIP